MGFRLCFFRGWWVDRDRIFLFSILFIEIYCIFIFRFRIKSIKVIFELIFDVFFEVGL